MICIMSPFPLFLSASPGTLTKSQVGLTPGVCLLEAERRPLSPKDSSGTGGPGAKLYSAQSPPPAELARDAFVTTGVGGRLEEGHS